MTCRSDGSTRAEQNARSLVFFGGRRIAPVPRCGIDIDLRQDKPLNIVFGFVWLWLD